MRHLIFAAIFSGLFCFAVPTQEAHAVAALTPQRIANRAQSIAEDRDSVGRCFRAVKDTLKPMGVELTGVSAYMAKSQLMQDDRFRIVVADRRIKPKDLPRLKKGDIVVHGKSGKHPHGHIAVYLGNNKEASDHVQKLVLGNSYSSTTVFRVKGSEIKVAAKPSVSRKTTVASSVRKNTIASANRKRTVASAKQRKQTHALLTAYVKENKKVNKPKENAVAMAARVAKPKAAWSYVNIANNESEALRHAVSVAKPKKNWAVDSLALIEPAKLFGLLQ